MERPLSAAFPQDAFELEQCIEDPFFKEIFPSTSLVKIKSLLLGWIIEHAEPEIRRALPQRPKTRGRRPKQEPKEFQTQIDTLKHRLIGSLQGEHFALSTGREKEKEKCSLETLGLIEQVASFQRKINLPFSGSSFASENFEAAVAPPPKRQKTAQPEEEELDDILHSNEWFETDWMMLLEETGTRGEIIQVIKNRLEKNQHNLTQPLSAILSVLENTASSCWPETNGDDQEANEKVIEKCKKELPEIDREQRSRLLLGLEMIQSGLGIVQIPEWWIEKELEKPFEERNLMSINTGCQQVAKWMKQNLLQRMETINDHHRTQLLSTITGDYKVFSGCQAVYSLGSLLSGWNSDQSGRDQLVEMQEVLMSEKNRLLKDLEKQLVIVQNSDYAADVEDRNIVFLDPYSRIQRKLSQTVVGECGGVANCHSLQTCSSIENPAAVEMTRTIIGIKIALILKEIREIREEHESELGGENSVINRVTRNLPPPLDCIWGTLISFLGRENLCSTEINFVHLSSDRIRQIPAEIKYLDSWTFQSIKLEEFQLHPLVDRLKFIFEKCRNVEKIEFGLKIHGMFLEDLLPLILKMEEISSLSSATVLSKLQFKQKGIESQSHGGAGDQSIFENRKSTLVSEIGQLSTLQALKLKHNLQLKTIPKEIGHLKNLTDLDLGSNSIRTIPPDISQLQNLQSLKLDDNQLQNLPLEMSQLGKLRVLRLSKNQFQVIPPAIFGLPGLLYLWMSANFVDKITDEIEKLSALEELSLWNNQLEIVSSGIGNLVNLKILTLGGNRLVSLPPEIGRLEKLNTLNLQGNRIVSIPSEIGQLSKLEQLNVRNNRIESLPLEIGLLSLLKNLNLENNPMELDFYSRSHPIYSKMSGTFQIIIDPFESSDLGRFFKTVFTAKQGKIPEDLLTVEGWLNATKLDLRNHQITIFPASISHLKNLQKLNLWTNKIKSIPPEIGWLTNLQTINFGKNQITSIASEIGKLVELQSLDLNTNNLSLLPQTTRKLVKLRILDLSRNCLDFIPLEIFQLPNLRSLEIKENKISSIPPEIRQLKNLRTLLLSSNKISAIPTTIAKLTNLKNLDLYCNNLTSIPSELFQLPNLSNLNLSENQLSFIPATMSKLKKLETSWLKSLNRSESSKL